MVWLVMMVMVGRLGECSKCEEGQRTISNRARARMIEGEGEAQDPS